MPHTDITPSLREDLETIIEATGPLEDAAPEFQDLVARVRAATSLPMEDVETQALRLAGRSIAGALVAVEDARGALTTIHRGLANRLAAIHDAIRAQA